MCPYCRKVFKKAITSITRDKATVCDECRSRVFNKYIFKKNFNVLIIKNLKNKTITYSIYSKDKHNEVKNYKWHINHYGYVVHTSSITLHRLITNYKYDIVDHINRNKLDNRNENLRDSNTTQNAINKDLQSNNKSGYRGVCWHRTLKKWRAYIKINNKHIYLGVFKDKNKAIEVRKIAEDKYFKQYL